MSEIIIDNRNLIDTINYNPEFKKKFLDGLNKLGFPLEFKIRQKLRERGYNSVQEGFFTVSDGNQQIVRSFDLVPIRKRRRKY